MTIRLLLADDHAGFREYLAQLLAREPGLQVLGQVDNPRAARQALQAAAAASDAPLVLLTDIELQGTSGIALTRDLRALCPRVRVLVLSLHDDAAFVSAMAEAGALGYALKGDPLPELVRAITQVAAGQVYRSPSLS